MNHSLTASLLFSVAALFASANAYAGEFLEFALAPDPESAPGAPTAEGASTDSAGSMGTLLLLPLLGGVLLRRRTRAPVVHA